MAPPQQQQLNCKHPNKRRWRMASEHTEHTGKWKMLMIKTSLLHVASSMHQPNLILEHLPTHRGCSSTTCPLKLMLCTAALRQRRCLPPKLKINFDLVLKNVVCLIPCTERFTGQLGYSKWFTTSKSNCNPIFFAWRLGQSAHANRWVCQSHTPPSYQTRKILLYCGIKGMLRC